MGLMKDLLNKTLHTKIKEKKNENNNNSGDNSKNNGNNNNYVTMSQLQTEIQRLHKENETLKAKCDANDQTIENMTFDLQFYQSRCEQLSNKLDSELITFDKYQSDLMDLKQELLHKDALMTQSSTIVNLVLKNTCINTEMSNNNGNDQKTNNESNNNNNEAKDSILRLSYDKIDDILSWHNFMIKFQQCVDLLDQYERASHRSRQRLKNMISIHSEKLKNLNLRNISHVTLKV